MSPTVIAIAVCAGLFVLYGLLPHRGCSGHCTGCVGECGHRDHEGDDHVG